MVADPRIGVLTTSYPRFDGDLSGHFVEHAAELLAHTGYQVIVSAPHEPGLLGREARKGVAVERFRYACPEAFERVAYGSGILANLRQDGRARWALPGFLLALILAGRRLAKASDLIHAHWIPSGLAAILGSWRVGPPVIVTIWGSDLPLVRRSGLVRRALTRAASIIAVSEAMRAELVAMGLPADHVHVVRTAIHLADPPRADRQTLRRSLGLDERTTVAFLGRLSHVKGPDVLMGAVSAGMLEETDSQLVFLGGGNMQDALQDVARTIPGGRVRFEGFVPHGRVSEWLGAIDLLVLPSRSEGLPLALIEALSQGVPVVASSVGGIPEVMNAGEVGWMVPPEDPAALERALRLAVSDRERLHRMGRAGKALVAEGGFDGSRLRDDLSRLYSAALSARRAASTASEATSSQSKR